MQQPRRIPIDFEDDRFDALPLVDRRRSLRRAENLGPGAHDMEACSGVGLSRLALAFAADCLEFFVRCHRRLLALGRLGGPAQRLRNTKIRIAPAGGVNSPLPRSRDPAGEDPSGLGVGAAVRMNLPQ